MDLVLFALAAFVLMGVGVMVLPRALRELAPALGHGGLRAGLVRVVVPFLGVLVGGGIAVVSDVEGNRPMTFVGFAILLPSFAWWFLTISRLVAERDDADDSSQAPSDGRPDPNGARDDFHG